MKVSLYQLHPKQAEIRQEAKRFNVLNCGRRWGKSKLAVNLLCEPAIDGYPTAYFAPNYKILKDTWKDVVWRLSDIINTKQVQDKSIDLITGGNIEFWTLEDPNAGRSRKYKRVIIDEAAMSRNLEEAWTQAIRPTLTDLKGDAWFMSTPKGRNYFYSLCQRSEPTNNWKYWKMPTSSNPYIDNNEIEDAKKELPVIVFEQEYLANFAENESNPFGFDYIDACLIEKLSNKETMFYGIDIAFKHDWTVIIGLDEDGAMSHYERFQKPLTETENHIKQLVKNDRALMDATGLGRQMYDNLRLSNMGLKGMVYTGGRGDNSKYKLINGLIVNIQQGGVKVLESEVSKELYNFTYLYTASGVKYEAPSGLHDDCVNALALAVKCKEFAPVYQDIVFGDEIIKA
jgi:hypothetical protein